MRRKEVAVGAAFALFLTLVLSGAALGADEPAAIAPADEGMIQLNLPPVVELKALIEYVSKRLSMNIIYDEAIGATRVAILTPARIKKDQLEGLLRNVLKMANLDLVDTAQADWKTIGRKATIRFVTVKNVTATDLAKRVSTALEEQARIAGGGPKLAPRVAGPRAGPAAAPMAVSPAGSEVTLVPDAKTNQIAVVATESEMAAALKLIDLLDVALNIETRIHRLKHVNPQRIDSVMRHLVPSEGPDPAYLSSIDEASGLLIVTAAGSIQKQVELLAREIDVEGDSGRGNIQFYKLVNTTAADVLQTIRSLQGGGPTPAKTEFKPLLDSNTGGSFTGPNMPSSPGLSLPPAPPSYRSEPASQPAEGGISGAVASALGKDAIVSADQNTNTLIVVAPPDVQRMYKQLVTVLDKRRPQVMVEVTLVTLDTSNEFSLGVELGGVNFGDDHSLIVFNSFGLSTVDPITGIPTLRPAAGFNGILVSPKTLNVVVQALATNARSKVLAAPRILMNDNATGKLTSVSESPFTSVNASATVSTTSFAGYASAGTQVAITPHISEGDYLQLKYSVILNSFTGQESDSTVPPPRQTDTVDSEVTVPNGYAVIVGGLTRKDFSRTVQKVPFLGDIPILKYLVSAQNQQDHKSTLFVFIRPIILRDDKFEDLKYLSDRDLESAQLPPNFPCSEPIFVR